jgi:hypothetical protein
LVWGNRPSTLQPPLTLDGNGLPFSVRRRGKQLAPEWQKSGVNFSAVAWDETVLLNMVLQGHYSLTAIACRYHTPDLMSHIIIASVSVMVIVLMLLLSCIFSPGLKHYEQP